MPHCVHIVLAMFVEYSSFKMLEHCFDLLNGTHRPCVRFYHIFSTLTHCLSFLSMCGQVPYILFCHRDGTYYLNFLYFSPPFVMFTLWVLRHWASWNMSEILPSFSGQHICLHQETLALNLSRQIVWTVRSPNGLLKTRHLHCKLFHRLPVSLPSFPKACQYNPRQYIYTSLCNKANFSFSWLVASWLAILPVVIRASLMRHRLSVVAQWGLGQFSPRGALSNLSGYTSGHP